LQVLLGLAGVAHVLIGAGVNLSSRFPAVVARLYGAQIDWSPQFAYILKPLGVFMIVLGALILAAARDPVKHGAVVNALVTLLALRILQRIVCRQEIADAFAMTAQRNITNIVFFLILAVAIFVLHRQARKVVPQA
jgi:hypothetical protein